MTDNGNEYEEMIDAQMKEWSTQIDLLMLKSKADTARAGAQRDDDKFMWMLT